MVVLNVMSIHGNNVLYKEIVKSQSIAFSPLLSSVTLHTSYIYEEIKQFSSFLIYKIP